jgi:hypothetical protein
MHIARHARMLASIGLLGLTYPSVSAAASGGNVACEAAKLKGVANFEYRLIRCATNANGCAGSTLRSFTTLGPCPGDYAKCSQVAQECAGSVSGVFTDTSPPSKCEISKRKAAAKLAKAELRCYAQAEPYGPPDAGCLDRARTTFSAAVSKAGNCPDGGSPESLVEERCVHRIVGEVIPICGDGVCATTEECDGGDDAQCPGRCNANCKCSVCGNGTIEAGEQCEPSKDSACPGRCQGDCTCPPPVCGNGIKEAGEQCDGSDASACPSLCQPDCTCPPPVCGNGIVESGETCDPPTPFSSGPPWCQCTTTCHYECIVACCEYPTACCDVYSDGTMCCGPISSGICLVVGQPSGAPAACFENDFCTFGGCGL